MNILLIDTSNIAYILTNQIGIVSDNQAENEDTELLIKAYLAFINSRVWLTDRDSYHVIWLHDSKPYWREIYEPEYKKNRGISPIYKTIKMVGEIVKNNFYSLSFEGFEGDDIAGKICNFPGISGRRILVTTDSDWMGLISDKVRIYNPIYPPINRGVVESYAWLVGKHNKSSSYVKERFRIPNLLDYDPSMIWNFKTIEGDKSDNLPPGSALGLISLKEPFIEPPVGLRHIKEAPIKGYDQDKANAFFTQGISPLKSERMWK